MATNLQSEAVPVTLEQELPAMPEFVAGIRRAPDRGFRLSPAQTEIALKNALRYIPVPLHEELSSEFLEELLTRGRIYGYRFRPPGTIKAKPVAAYQGNCLAGKAFQLMIDNNLDFDVALYPYELVTYGETGSVCQNWMQYLLIKKYLETMNDNQTLVVESGHPLGLFRSSRTSPRVVITNALMVGMFDNHDDWETAEQMGVANYGQMTAGGWMYIGPQGIVHGTYNTLLHAGRLKLGLDQKTGLSGHLFVSSGLGGMSGAQAKAIEIAGGVGIIAEVDYSRIKTRIDQGWVRQTASNPRDAVDMALKHVAEKKAYSIAFYGNIVDLLEYLVDNRVEVGLLSDQTSCHAPYEGGYCPQGITFEERTKLLKENRAQFKDLVNQSLQRHFSLIKTLTVRGTYFFDYGNSFMKAVFDAGVREIARNGRDEKDGFIFPSYVEDIMGPLLFDFGYGPFRWVCLSGRHEDLQRTDRAAMDCIDPDRRPQDRDNYNWIRDAEKNSLVIGTQARILYQDAEGRVKIALRFNEMVRNGEIGPVMIGRDHHDTGGTDSPFRETANIKDGSNVMADMATQCFAGNAARGMTMVSLHNGGGVGIGKAINGGFGLLLDGSREVDETIQQAIRWDVMGGVARRAWAGNKNALEAAIAYNRTSGTDRLTIPFSASDELVRERVSKALLT
jgi:urocanate hydratase